MMNVRGNVHITKVSDTKDREQVVVALAGNDAMPPFISNQIMSTMNMGKYIIATLSTQKINVYALYIYT